jgi:ribosome-associated toxin RatA of RatAB toxin-antitoxin module
MREVRHAAIVPYCAELVFALVADVDSYAGFVPGCTESRVDARIELPGDSEEVIATLGLRLAGQTGRFTTRNRVQKPNQIHMSLIKGPFAVLEGEWRIEALGDNCCRLELHMKFVFSRRLMDALLGPVFELTCNHLVEAFVRRARHLYD